MFVEPSIDTPGPQHTQSCAGSLTDLSRVVQALNFCFRNSEGDGFTSRFQGPIPGESCLVMLRGAQKPA